MATKVGCTHFLLGEGFARMMFVAHLYPWKPMGRGLCWLGQLCRWGFTLGCACLLLGSFSPRSLAAPLPEVVVVVDSAPTTLDPFLATDAISARVTHQLLCDTLIRLDVDLRYAAGVFSAWRASQGGRVWHFTLGKGQYFQNGQRVGAQDVVFSLKRFADTKVGSPYGSPLREAGMQVKQVGKDQVRLRFKVPRPYVLADLILPVVARNSTPKHWVCSGPFRLLRQSPAKWEFMPHTQHVKGGPKVRLTLLPLSDETARFLRFRKSEAHLGINALSARRLKAFRKKNLAKHYRTVLGTGLTHQYLGFNLKHPALAKRKVRQALAQLVPVDALMQHLLHGLGERARGVLPNNSRFLHPKATLWAYNVQKAKALLDEAGYAPKANGQRLALRYSATNNPSSMAMARILAASFAKAGVKLTLRSYEWGIFYSDILKGRFDIYSLRWIGVFEPRFRYRLLHSSQTPPQGRNRGYYQNAQMDIWLEASQHAKTPEARRAWQQKIHQRMLIDLPFLPLWQRKNAVIVHRRVRNFVQHPSGGFETLHQIEWR